MQYGHAARGALVQIVADAGLELAHLHPTVVIGLADGGNEILDGLGGDAAPAQAAQGGEARVVPATHDAVLDQLAQFALAHHGVGEVETGKLDLARFELAQLFQEPFVERAMDNIFIRAQRVGDPFHGVVLPMATNRTSGRCTTCHRCGGGGRA